MRTTAAIRSSFCIMWLTRLWLLLRQAVQRAQSPHQIDGVNADHLAAREQAGQDVQCVAVVGIVERRHQHAVVGDIEVGVTRRQALALENRLAPASAIRRFPVACRPGRSCRARRSRFSWSGSKLASPRSLSTTVTMVLAADEPGQVVDVAMRVVAGDAAAQPQHFANAEVLGEALSPVLCGSCPGLRACTSLSRHSSVVSSKPAPLTSMLPPSRTMLRVPDHRLPRAKTQRGGHLGWRSWRRFASWGIWPRR